MSAEPQPGASGPQRRALNDPAWLKYTLITLALSVLFVLVILPVVHVFYLAFSKGLVVYWNNLTGDPYTRHAIGLTLIVAPTAVVMNLLFGVAAAWCIAKFQFPGRTLLVTCIDIPFAVSPVVAGLCFVLLFGLHGWFGPWLEKHDIQILFAVPALILVTAFTTLPFVARELIPLMESLGSEEEMAAVSLGANGWQMFWSITIPNIKWGLIYGVILCNARAMGEFGAVYVVSGHIAGRTETMPLEVEKLFQDSNMPAAFAVASLLTGLALVTLAIKSRLEALTRAALADAAKTQPAPGESA